MQREALPWNSLPWNSWYSPAAVVLPFVLVASFIVITHELVRTPHWIDWLGWTGSVAAGAYCVWRLPLARSVRATLVCLYVPTIALLVLAFWLGVLASRYELLL